DKAAVERQIGAPERDSGGAHRGDTAEHVARAATIHAAIADLAAKWVDRPPFPHRHRVQVTVEHERRTVRRTNLGDDVRPTRSNLTQTRRDAVVFEVGGKDARNRLLAPRRVLAGHANEGAKEVESLPIVDRRENSRPDT